MNTSLRLEVYIDLPQIYQDNNIFLVIIFLIIAQKSAIIISAEAWKMEV
jgi:hypothetical protein